MSGIVGSLLSWVLAFSVSAVIFLAIPVSNYIGMGKAGEPGAEAHAVQLQAKMPPKKQKPPPKKKKVPPKKSQQTKAPKQMARQNLAMDLTPGGGSGGASIAMAGGAMGSMTYEEGETDSDIQFISGRNPQYPSEASKAGIHGRVETIITVDENGKVAEIEFLETPGDYGFEDSIREALNTWRFRPAMLNGIPVRQKMQQPFEF